MLPKQSKPEENAKGVINLIDTTSFYQILTLQPGDIQSGA